MADIKKHDALADKAKGNDVQFLVRECPVCGASNGETEYDKKGRVITNDARHLYTLAQRQVLTIPTGKVKAGQLYEVICKQAYRKAWLQAQRAKTGDEGVDAELEADSTYIVRIAPTGRG